MTDITVRLDLAPIETRPARSGYLLKCPRCARWSTKLLIVGKGQLACRFCRPKDAVT